MLEDISGEKLKKMSVGELCALADEVRHTIISTVEKRGGHLSSNLGMVELTIALHYVFDFPRDKVIFDVGHQCYTHKLLSGRYKDFGTLRLHGGLSGFPKREESEYDCYNTGHAGTSVSAALGIAKARDIVGDDYSVIAVIGDGSFNNGLIYEALNSLKLLNTRILVILNDNGMSISPTVGSMHEYLEELSADASQSVKLEKNAQLFSRFGLCYDGVYDGNDVKVMIDKLSEIKEKLKTQSVILHIATVKGKGYAFCEENPEITHGVSAKGEGGLSEYSQALGDTLVRLAEKDDKIVAVTAAMTSGLGLSEFFRRFPDRSVDVGICEEHATVLCAAMATAGLKPYYAVYSTFLQRSFDELVVDICSQNLPVTICIDRAGVAGSDGETHQGVFDLSYLSMIPNLTVAVPKSVAEFKKMLEFSVNFGKPLAIRYPRFGAACKEAEENAVAKIEVGKWEAVRLSGADTVILACGERAMDISARAISALRKKNIAVDLVNARFVKPLDTEILDNLDCKNIITVEDNVLSGGFGSCVATYLEGSGKKIKSFAYCDKFLPHGSVNEIMEENGVCADGVIRYIENENR